MSWEPEPETLESMKAQGTQQAMPSVYRCGCEYRESAMSRWHLCSYHEGFEAGLECARSVPEPTEPEEQ